MFLRSSQVLIKCINSNVPQYFSIMSNCVSDDLMKKKKIKIHHKFYNNQIVVISTSTKQIHNTSNLKNINDNVVFKTMSGHDLKMDQSKNDVKVQYLDTPIKSEADKKEYRVIRLPNGLTALLIADIHSNKTGENDGQKIFNSACSAGMSSEDESSDEEMSTDEESSGNESEDISDKENEAECSLKDQKKEKMAACGLCIGVGSFSDPPEIPGLAHFLEHMVFMGSSKYPVENDFDSFIKKRGGSDNASTDCEQTTFYFEIDENYFLPALDRFAQFFISPLMLRDAINREREAVESEFQLALPVDSNRKEQLFGSLAKPGYPATKFTWGNLVTLRDNVTDDKLYEKLHEFRERHYSAHRMTLAIQARFSLDILEDYVKKCFSDVPNNNLPRDDFTEFSKSESFDTPSFKRIYRLKPIKNKCKVELNWAMPSVHHLYHTKPLDYISLILGHEGKGSLISYLRGKMWGIDLTSGNSESGFEHNSMYALYSISIKLTDDGYSHLKEVLDSVFSYINLLQKLGPQQRIFDENVMITNTGFKFCDELSPSDYVEHLCENMQFFPPKDYITGGVLVDKYDIDSITKCMQRLTPENVNIMIYDKKLDDAAFDKTEQWFKSKYTTTEIPSEWIETWKTIEPFPEFHLPEPNIYITTDFSLIPIEFMKYPAKVFESDALQVWYKSDDKFRMPECCMYFLLVSSLVRASAAENSMIEMMVMALNLLLVEELYPASVAGLHEKIEINSDEGMIIKISGFNQKLPLVLDTICAHLAKCPELISEDLFQLIKTEQLKKYYNQFISPGYLCKDIRLATILQAHWSAVEKHAACLHISFDQFKKFTIEFTKQLYVKALVQGNITREDAVEQGLKFSKILKYEPIPIGAMPELRAMKLSLGSQCCRIQNFNKSDLNSVVINYYQSKLFTMEESVLMDMMTMIMDEPLFNQLRTLEQLGYNVSSTVHRTFGVNGFSIKVCTQVDKFSLEHVDNRIEEFLNTFKETLKNTSQDEFDNIKQSLIKLKQCADFNLKEEISKNWAEVVSREYMFDRVSKEVAAIELLTIEKLRIWMTEHTIGGNNLRKLSFQVVGNDSSSLDETQTSKLDDNAAIKYNYHYLGNLPNKVEHKPDKYFIMDILKYKEGLDVWPGIQP